MVRVLDDVGIVLIVIFSMTALLVVRRLMLRRSGAVLDLCVRPRGSESHWVLGLARYSGESLDWFRIFGFSARPSRSFRRDDISVVGRRSPSMGEAASFVHGAVVLECLDGGHRLDLALPATAMTGFQAWLEAHTPGATAPSRSETPDDSQPAKMQRG